MAELKPCPFCGSNAVMQTFQTARERKPRYRVRCSECWCETNWDNFSADEAADAWNRRDNNG